MMKTIVLNDGHYIDVPDRDYPWVQEWLWMFDSETGRAYRVQDAKTVWLYHELIKRHRNDPAYVTLGDDALSPLFAKFSAYDEMADKWVERLEIAGQGNILLPDPADILTCTLTAVLYLYYDWLTGGKWHELTPNGDLIFHTLPRPLLPAKQYSTLGEWMDAEYTGMFHEGPELFLDKAHEAAETVLSRLLQDDNPNKDPDWIVQYFDDARLPMDGVLNPIVWLVKSYPIPEI
jgi:hypothetical protein